MLKCSILKRGKAIYPLWVGGKVLPLMDEFKCHALLFTSEKSLGHERDWWICGVLWLLRQSTVVKRELSQKARSQICIPILM